MLLGRGHLTHTPLIYAGHLLIVVKQALSSLLAHGVVWAVIVQAACMTAMVQVVTLLLVG